MEPTLVFLPGLGADHRLFENQTAAFPKPSRRNPYFTEFFVMGVDLLDIVYRLEKKYSIRIDRADLIGPMEEWEAAAKAGKQQKLQDQYADRLTVRFLCDVVERKVREQNKGKTDFPCTREEILQGVTEALCEALAVKPEEIMLDARIYKDLGAE